jgi:uncharacterized protein YgiM (DUF1202 family)
VKRKLILILCILIALPLFSQSKIEEQRNLIRGNVKDQKDSNRANKEALQQKMKSYMADINNGIKGSGKNIAPPINIDDITDLSKQDSNHNHSNKKKPEPIYAYSNVKDLNMRSESNTKSLTIDKIAFAEKVQVLGKTSDNNTIDKVSAPWILIRKSNDREGWVFGKKKKKDVPNQKEASKDESNKESFASKLEIPVEGRISSNYGTRIDPITKKSGAFHSGIDFAAPQGTPVYSAEDGTISTAEWNNGGYGNLIIVKHADDLTTYYGHLYKMSVKGTQKVKRGELIGEVGSTGYSTGPHLHFEVRRGGTALDPNEFTR